MEYFPSMKDSKGSYHLNQNSPDFLLAEVTVRFLEFDNFLVEISIISETHNKTKAGRLILKERFFVTDDCLVVDWSKDSNFIKRIFFLFAAKFAHLDLLQGVDLRVADSFDFEHFAVRTLAFSIIRWEINVPILPRIMKSAIELETAITLKI